jgi:formylglycine-generating enzyme required for sulfatase activity
VVLEQLWRAKPAGEERLTLGQYRALGGARTLLVGHLRAALDEELKERAPLARKVLRAMVTDRSTKAVLTASRLALRSGLPADDVKPLLAELVRVRLVRTLPGEAEPLFELAHEFLISEVRSWAEEEGLLLTHARMVLRTELEHWGRFRVLLGPELLAVVAREQPRLHPSSAERAMLLRASAVHGQPIAGWLGQGAVERESVAVLLELLGQGALPGSAALGASAQRRIVEALFPLVLSEVAEGALLDAAERVAHPGTVAALKAVAAAKGLERRLAALERRVTRRFDGPVRVAGVPAGLAWVGASRENRDARLARAPRALQARIAAEPDLKQVQVPGYGIARRLVTNEDFAEFRPAHRFAPERARHPVVNVSLADAQAYAAWLGHRLPTEVEWEKACRGPDGRLFPWGDTFDPSRCNALEGGLGQTSPVDAYLLGASPYGCLDMAGNVAEWTASAWSADDPRQVQKGGTALQPEPLQQGSARAASEADAVSPWVGFRTVCGEPLP